MTTRDLAGQTVKGAMTNAGTNMQGKPLGGARRTSGAGVHIPMRFVAIWIALAALMLAGRIFLPQSVELTSLMSILPFAAFLACATMGQTLVLMARGIDLSPPAIISLSSTVLLGVSGGHDDRMALAIIVALLAAVAVGLINGVLVAMLKLNALIVTLSTGAIVAGLTLWYRQSLAAESKVPGLLADFGGSWFLGLPISFWIVAVLTVIITVLMKKTVIGRRFEAAGANPRAAYATGVEVNALPGRQLRRCGLPIWRDRDPALRLHPKSNARGWKSLPPWSDRRGGAWRDRDQRRHRQYVRGRRRLAVSHAARSLVEDAWPCNVLPVDHSGRRNRGWHVAIRGDEPGWSSLLSLRHEEVASG